MSEPLIQVSALLEPVSEENPTGAEFHSGDADSSLFRAKNARDDAFAAEERRFRAKLVNEPEDALPRPDWRSVVDSTSAVLIDQSKDFRAACWLTEALVRLAGFAGLSQGLQVCRGLCERYWDGLRPVPSADEGHMPAMGPFAGVCGDAVRRRLNLWPITSDGLYTLDDYMRATRPVRGNENAEPSTSPEVAAADIFASARSTGSELYKTLVVDVETALESLRWLTQFFQEHCLPDEYGESSAPTTGGLLADLEQAALVSQALRDAVIGPDEGGGSENSDEPTAGANEPAAQRAPAGPIASRQEALRTLLKIADFFERTEPHSPVSYALRQVVRWGDMKLPELLAELISDDGVRADLTRRVGVPLQERE